MLRLNLTSENGNSTGKFRVNWITMSEGGTQNSNFQCGSYYGEKQKLWYTPVNSQENQTEKNPISYQMSCQSQCIFRINRSDLCSNQVREELVNPQLTFWLYLLLRFIFVVFISASATLFDGASLVLVNQVCGDFGFQKMFGYRDHNIFSDFGSLD